MEPFAEIEETGDERKKTAVRVKFKKTIEYLTAMETVGGVWTLRTGGGVAGGGVLSLWIISVPWYLKP